MRQGKGKIDPVSRPEYNIINIIKQSILAEEHLTQPHKRCSDCIAKHLLHMQALAEEAQWLAADKGPYPALETLGKFYGDVFESWRKGKRTGVGMMNLAARLRKQRKELVSLYVTRMGHMSTGRSTCRSCVRGRKTGRRTSRQQGAGRQGRAVRATRRQKPSVRRGKQRSARVRRK